MRRVRTHRAPIATAVCAFVEQQLPWRSDLSLKHLIAIRWQRRSIAGVSIRPWAMSRLQVRDPCFSNIHKT